MGCAVRQGGAEGAEGAGTNLGRETPGRVQSTSSSTRTVRYNSSSPKTHTHATRQSTQDASTQDTSEPCRSHKDHLPDSPHMPYVFPSGNKYHNPPSALPPPTHHRPRLTTPRSPHITTTMPATVAPLARATAPATRRLLHHPNPPQLAASARGCEQKRPQGTSARADGRQHTRHDAGVGRLGPAAA